MINAILKGIIKFITSLIGIFLLPINTLINNAFPNFANLLDTVSSFFHLVIQYFGYILDMLCIDSNTISFLILFWTFKLTIPYLVYLVKLIVQWYDKLKL